MDGKNIKTKEDMIMTNLKMWVILIGVMLLGKGLMSQESIVLTQSGSPLVLTDLNATYQAEFGQYSREGIRYRATVANQGGKTIVAYQLGFIAFDVFNRQLGEQNGGYAIEEIPPMGSKKGEWMHRPLNSGLFKKYGTGIGYVRVVRFSDGEIWTYNAEEILEQLQKYAESLTKEDLEIME